MTKQWDAEYGVSLFQGWLGNSPDLNPIEDLWSQMRVMQSHKRATSVAGLKKIALSVWKRIMPLLGKKSKLIRFFDSWGRNPVFQFSLGPFEKVG